MWRRVVLVAGLVVVVACRDDDAAEVSSATSDVTATTGAATTELPTPTDDPSGEELSWVLLDDFESGSLEGWQVAAVNGGWNAYGDEQTLASFPPAPPQGGFAAATAPTGPGTRILYRDVSLEGEMTLHLSVFYESEAQISTPGTLGHDSAEPNQQFRVDVVDPAAPFDSVADGDVLLDVFATEPGDPLSLEPTEVAIDVAEITGRTVRLRIAEVDNQGPMSAGVDNIRFESTGVDVSIGLPDTPAAHRLSDPGAVAASREADPSELLATFEESMPEFLSQASVPGAAIAVIRNGEVVATEGYGFANVEASIAVTPTTPFNVGSISKTIAAWGVMTLVEQGRIDLDAPVATYLTRWSLPESEFDEDGVTMRRLLSHTAGLSLHGYPGWGPDQLLPTIEESLSGNTNGAGAVELVIEPGTRWQYSGGGYTLAQLIVEEVTGEPFADYVRDAVLRPLGMANSDYHLSDELMSRSSIAYDERGVPTPNPRFTEQAAAGLHTTVEDLATFAAAALVTDDGEVPGRGVLSPETIALMLTPASASGESYGLGYEVVAWSDRPPGRARGSEPRVDGPLRDRAGDGRRDRRADERLHRRAVIELVTQEWDRWLAGDGES